MNNKIRQRRNWNGDHVSFIFELSQGKIGFLRKVSLVFRRVIGNGRCGEGKRAERVCGMVCGMACGMA